MIHLFIAEGFEEIEAFTTLDILRRCNLEIQTISITGTRTIRGAHGITIMADNVFRRTEILKTQGIILPGGMPGVNNLLRHEGLRKCLTELIQTPTLIAAICAAPMILGRHQLLENRIVTCYPGFEQELKGAHLSDLGIVEDQNLITAKGPAYSVDFASRIAERFVSPSVIEAQKQAMLYHEKKIIY